jgi:hypothetical protein
MRRIIPAASHVVHVGEMVTALLVDVSVEKSSEDRRYLRYRPWRYSPRMVHSLSLRI